MVTRGRSRVGGGRDGRTDESARPVHVVDQRRAVDGLVIECRCQSEHPEAAGLRRTLEGTPVFRARAVPEDLRDFQPDVEVHVAAPVPEGQGIECALGVVGAPGHDRRVEWPAHDGLTSVAQAEDDEHPPPARGLVDDLLRCRKIRLDAHRHRLGSRGLGDGHDRWRVLGVAETTVDDSEECGARTTAAPAGVKGGIGGERDSTHGVLLGDRIGKSRRPLARRETAEVSTKKYITQEGRAP